MSVEKFDVFGNKIWKLNVTKFCENEPKVSTFIFSFWTYFLSVNMNEIIWIDQWNLEM